MSQFVWDQVQQCITWPLLLIKAKWLQTWLKYNPSTGKFCFSEVKALLHSLNFKSESSNVNCPIISHPKISDVQKGS